MRHYVDELLDCLALYQSLLRQGCVGQEYLEEITRLNNEIEELQNAVKNGGDYSSFNYKALKRDLARLFHPDIFKPPVDLLDNPDELLGRTFGVMKQIDDYKKTFGSSSFKYNTATGSGFRDHAQTSSRDSQQESKKQKATNPGSNGSFEPDQEKKTHSHTNSQTRSHARSNTNSRAQADYYDDFDYEEDWKGFTPQQETDTYYDTKVSITQLLMDRINAIFRGIPSTMDDYDRILERYEKTEESLTERIGLLRQCINSLRREEWDLKNERARETSDDVIEGIYNSRLESLYRTASLAYQTKNRLQDNRAQRSTELEPKVRHLWAAWKEDARNYISQYNQLLQYYTSCRSQLANVDYEKLESELQEMADRIEEHYGDERAALKGIRNAVLDRDPQYQELVARSKEAMEKFKDADLNYKNYLANPEPHKKQIKEQIDGKYEQDLAFIDAEISTKQKKKDKLEKRLMKVRGRKQDFVDEYGETFGPTTSKGK